MGRYAPGKYRRRSIRLPGYDYRAPGAYFVTICVRLGECLLGQVADGEMRLSPWGEVADRCWQRIPRHFDHVRLDAWVVMPNHVHGILVITHRGGEAFRATGCEAEPVPGDASPPQGRASGVAAGSLGAIVGNWKSVTTRRINDLRQTPGVPFWQRNYWEHVIRDEASWNRIRRYIEANPARWAEDQLHPGAPPNRFNPWR